MSYSQTRLGAPRSNFAENHPYVGEASKHDDDHNERISHEPYQADTGCRESAFPDAPSMSLRGLRSQGHEENSRQNDKALCQCDKPLLQEKFGAELFEKFDDSTNKMSNFLHQDKLTENSEKFGPDAFLTGHNVRLEGDLYFDDSHLGTGSPTASSRKVTASKEAFSFPSKDEALKSSSDQSHVIRPLSRAPLTPQTWQEAEKLAKLLCKTKLVPPGFESPDLCLIAILQGMEMGLPPLTALQRMALVEGKLTLWGDGALALVLKSGLCTSITEWMGLGDQDELNSGKANSAGIKDMTFDPLMQKREDEWIAFCEVTRAHWLKPIRRSFSVIDAKRAGLWKKEGPWLDYPKRMLQMRARAFALRDAFADVLGGLYVREEIEPKGAYTNPLRNSVPASQSNQKTTVQERNLMQDPQPESLHHGKEQGQIKQTQHNPGQKLASDGEAKDHNTHVPSAASQSIDPSSPHISKQSLIWSTPITSKPERKKAPPPPFERVKRVGEPKQKNRQEDDNTRTNNTNQSSKLEKNETNEENQERLEHAKGILNEFKAALQECHTLDDLDACRMKFQPVLGSLTSVDLDHAAQIYLDQEAQIEAAQSSLKYPPTPKRPRQYPQIRRWKAQYRPYQGKKGSKNLAHNIWDPAINHESPD